MTSAIVAIYTAIENLTILVDSKTPEVFGLTGLPNTVASAMLPCRILLDLANAGEGQNMEFVTINSGISGGGSQVIEHQISDLMLLLPLGQGQGNRQVGVALVTYYGAYIDAVRANRTLVDTPTNDANIAGLRCSPGVYEYPVGSGTFYWGCMTNLTIKEIIA